ncbi:MAG: helix-turn-helix transcriptional regulator [Ferruginibacter sp.]|nr:helix-turn-helix transcriptional regulator [Cytophagales bacterium]
MEKALHLNCPVTATMGVISGKWKPIILWRLLQDVRRFGELKRQIPGITPKMLTQQLRELEGDGLIERKVFAQVPPRVEYTFTEYGETLQPLLHAMGAWGRTHWQLTMSREP